MRVLCVFPHSSSENGRSKVGLPRRSTAERGGSSIAGSQRSLSGERGVGFLSTEALEKLANSGFDVTERALRFPPGERLHVPLLDPRGPGGEEFRDHGAMFPVIESNDAGCLFQVLSAQGCLCQAGETQADPLAAEGAFCVGREGVFKHAVRREIVGLCSAWGGLLEKRLD